MALAQVWNMVMILVCIKSGLQPTTQNSITTQSNWPPAGSAKCKLLQLVDHGGWILWFLMEKISSQIYSIWTCQCKASLYIHGLCLLCSEDKQLHIQSSSVGLFSFVLKSSTALFFKTQRRSLSSVSALLAHSVCASFLISFPYWGHRHEERIFSAS